MARITIGRVLSSAVDSVTAVQGSPPWLTKELTGLIPKEFDFIALGYNGAGQVTSAVYKLGGVSGAVVASLAITYVAGLVATVTRV